MSRPQPKELPRPRLARSARPATFARDQEASTFSAILDDLVARIPGARAAALVDGGGETVDYGGHGDPFDVRVSAAHWQLVAQEMRTSLAPLGPIRTVVIGAERRSFLVHELPEAYALVVLLGRRAGFGDSSRALAACERALCEEAGWQPRDDAAPWVPVAVTCDRRMRPKLVEVQGRSGGSELHAVEVLGAMVGLKPRERGFRVRLASGAELTLVREAGGYWYSEESLTGARTPDRGAARARTREKTRAPVQSELERIKIR